MTEQPTDLAGIIKGIREDVTTIVKGEVELAKAELLPQAKNAGIGAGLFGAAGYLAITGATLLFFGFAFAWAVGFQAWFDLTVLSAATWGLVVMAVIVFAIAGVLALIGRQKLVFTKPEATITRAEAAVAEVKETVAATTRVAGSLPLTGRPTSAPQLPARVE